MSSRTIYDAGHGGHDPGAISSDAESAEKEFTIDIAIAAARNDNGSALSRNDDHFLTLSERAEMANDTGRNLCSIHCNAGGGTGLEVFTSPGQTDSDDWATIAIEELHEEFPGMTIRMDISDGDADKEARFTVLTKTSGPAILVECGFMDNENDILFLREKDNRRRLGEAIARASRRFQKLQSEGDKSPRLTLEDHERRILALERGV